MKQITKLVSDTCDAKVMTFFGSHISLFKCFFSGDKIINLVT